MPSLVGYHGLTGQEHQQRVDTLAPHGYRPISLSVSGDGGDARDAAVWVQRAGPAWWAVHNLSAEAYQAKFNELVGQTQAYPFLGITSALLPDQTPDPAVNTITVDHLVNRRSGLTHARVTESGVVRTFEPSADLRTVAARLGRTTTPTRDDLVRYMYGEAPDFPPGSQQAYSNFAFTLLTSIVERASGRGFLDFLRAEVLAPQGLSEVWVGATMLAGRLPNEVRYDNPGVGLTVLQPTTNTYVPNVYGTFALENGEGTGGLVSTAPTVARFITQHAVWDAGPRIVATRHGTFDGMTSGARSRPDNLDFAYMFNRRVTDAEHDGITNAIDGYLNSHPV